MSEIVQVNDNTYLFATMKDRSIYFFNLNDKNRKQTTKINIGESRYRSTRNEYYMFWRTLDL